MFEVILYALAAVGIIALFYLCTSLVMYLWDRSAEQLEKYELVEKLEVACRQKEELQQEISRLWKIIDELGGAP